MTGEWPSWPSPEHDKRFLIEDEIDIVWAVNGKLRDKMTVACDTFQRRLDPKVQNAVGSQTIRKVVVVPKKLVNVVAN